MTTSETKIIPLSKPSDPISRGYATATELERHFSTVSNANFYIWHKAGKIPAYKFRGDTVKYFSIIEVLDNLPEDKMSETGKVLQDRYTTAKRAGNVNWSELYSELLPMLDKTEPRPKPAAVKRRPKLKAVLKETLSTPTEIPTLKPETTVEAQVAQQKATAPAKSASRFIGSFMDIKPMELEVNMSIKTKDPQLMFELAMVYEKLKDIESRIEQ